MKLSVREATELLGISENTLHVYIKRRGLPAHYLSERIYFNPMELWEWSVEQGIPVDRKLLDRARAAPQEIPALSEALAAGGVHHQVPGADRAQALHEVVARLPLPPGVDREFLAAALEAREAMGSTGIGDGIAIPHVRNPILLQVPDPFVTLCFLSQAIPFDAIDHQPVDVLFVLITPTVPVHLKILAELAFTLRDPALRGLLRARAQAPAILGRIEEIERGLGADAPAGDAPQERPAE